MKAVRRHLREMHDYTLEESVKWSPEITFDIHLQEHENITLGHTHESDERGDL